MNDDYNLYTAFVKLVNIQLLISVKTFVCYIVQSRKQNKLLHLIQYHHSERLPRRKFYLKGLFLLYFFILFTFFYIELCRLNVMAYS